MLWEKNKMTMSQSTEFNKFIRKKINQPKMRPLPLLNESETRIGDKIKYLSKFQIDKVSICRATRL